MCYLKTWNEGNSIFRKFRFVKFLFFKAIGLIESGTTFVGKCIMRVP